MVKKRGKEDVKKYESLKAKVKPIKKEKISKLTEIGESKKRELMRESGKGFPLIYAVLIFFVVAVIGGVLIFMNPSIQINTNPVEEGDIVQIIYTGKLEDGTVFDSGNFTFKTGSGEVISGVDQAVIGMRMGERKTVTLSPEQAYGYYNPENILSIPLVQELERTENITVEVFKLAFEEDPVINDLYQPEGMQWPVRVIDMQNETVVYRHEPVDGMVVEMKDNIGEVYGTSEISVKGEKITLTTHPIIGSVVTTIMGEGIITEANETHMMMDFNHKLAGETLIFDITLLNFISS